MTTFWRRTAAVALAAVLVVGAAPASAGPAPPWVAGLRSTLQTTVQTVRTTVQTTLPTALQPVAPVLGRATADRWLVVTEVGAQLDALVVPLARSLGLHVDGWFTRAVPAAVVTGPKAIVSQLASLPGVVMVVEDTVVDVLDPMVFELEIELPPGEHVPSNIMRVGGPGRGPVDVDVAVMDTGIDPLHPDLNVVGGKDCSFASRSRLIGPAPWADEDGHGTLGAGIIGAKADGQGMVGIAPGARLWSIKATATGITRAELEPDLYLGPSLDAGVLVYALYASNILCAADWLVSNADTIEVVNMSWRAFTPVRGCDGHVDAPLGTGRSQLTALLDLIDVGIGVSDLVEEALCSVTAAGVTVVAGTGNDARPLVDPDEQVRSIPATIPGVIAASGFADFDGVPGGVAGSHDNCAGLRFPGFRMWVPALAEAMYGPLAPDAEQDLDDTFADFSNHGAEVDVAAVATCTIGTRPGGGYQIAAGTSFAAPAVSGAAALIRAARPDATAEEVRALLRDTGAYDYDASDDPDGIPDPRIDIPTLEAALG